jgi:TrmH family RNA methyltransferase
MVITSHHNERLKGLRKLQEKRERQRTGLFAAEGEDLLDAADAAGWEAEARYCAAGSGLAGEEVEAAVLAAVSALGSGTRAVGVYRQRWAERPVGPLCLALWGVHDPGNVGTAIRSAVAFGADSVALGPDSADPYGPKAVRASMGAIFSVPVARVESIADLPGERIGLDPKGGQVFQCNSGKERLDPVSVVVGGERAGLPADVVEACDRVCRIPIDRAESLNAAMAATVALYELTRDAG